MQICFGKISKTTDIFVYSDLLYIYIFALMRLGEGYAGSARRNTSANSGGGGGGMSDSTMGGGGGGGGHSSSGIYILIFWPYTVYC